MEKELSPPPGGTPISPAWFNAPKHFAHMSPSGGIASHPFFDSATNTIKKEEIYFYPVTAKESPFGYQFDLLSGAKYRRFNYCERQDIWNDYEKSIHLPPYTMGIVPRVLDQLGDPQKVMVFGKVEERSSDLLGVTYLQKAKIVGGVILRYCKNYPCKGRGGWRSSLVLVAVSDRDSSLKGVRSMADLVNIVDWEQATTFLVNSGGHKVSFPDSLPAYRIGRRLDLKTAMKSLAEKGYHFTLKEMSSLRSNCYLLYDYIWKNVLKIKEDTEKIRKLVIEDDYRLGESYTKPSANSGTILHMEDSVLDQVAQKIESKELRSLNSWFWDFYAENGKDFATCSKFVRSSNLKSNIERHWFFVYLSNFFNLEKLGYYYHCPSQLWKKNLLGKSKKPKYTLNTKRECTNEQLNNAFISSIRMMDSLRHKKEEHYQYIEYDFGTGGSHRRIHNWVFSNGKELSCKEPYKKMSEKITGIGLIPSDVGWLDFSLKPNAASQYTIR